MSTKSLGLDEADFLVYCLQQWKNTISNKLGGTSGKQLQSQSQSMAMSKSMSGSASVTSNADGSSVVTASSDSSPKPPKSMVAKKKSPKRAKNSLAAGNALLAKGVSPYFESQQYLENIEAEKKKKLEMMLLRHKLEEQRSHSATTGICSRSAAYTNPIRY
jgi:hypothetical protein